MQSQAGSQGERLRAALYIDGFNLYHPIRRMGPENNHLKWACLWRLGRELTERHGQTLVKVLFCTAVPSTNQSPEKRDRHIRFNSAQRARGVTVIEGHYVPEAIEIDGEPTGQTKWTEKQTDINVALELIMDGLDDLYDVALLLSADTDQVATARVFTERLAPLGKTMVGIAPPDREAPMGYAQYNVRRVRLQKSDIEKCIMPAEIPSDSGLIVRPEQYSPPADWLHPDDRPKTNVPKPPKKSEWSKSVKG